MFSQAMEDECANVLNKLKASEKEVVCLKKENAILVEALKHYANMPFPSICNGPDIEYPLQYALNKARSRAKKALEETGNLK